MSLCPQLYYMLYSPEQNLKYAKTGWFLLLVVLYLVQVLITLSAGASTDLRLHPSSVCNLILYV